MSNLSTTKRRAREESNSKNKQPISAPPKNEAAVSANPKASTHPGDDDLSFNFTDSWSTAPASAALAVAVTPSRDAAPSAADSKNKKKTTSTSSAGGGGNYLLDNAALAGAFAPGGPSISLTRQNKITATPSPAADDKKKQQQQQLVSSAPSPSNTSKNSSTTTPAVARGAVTAKQEQPRVASKDKKQQQQAAQKPKVYIRDNREIAQQERQQATGVTRSPFDAPTQKAPVVAVAAQQQPQKPSAPASKAIAQPKQAVARRNDNDDDDDDATAPAVPQRNVVVQQDPPFAPETDVIFEQLHPRLRSAWKEKFAFNSLTYVQRASWPVISSDMAPRTQGGKPEAVGDVIIRSETGSGKTLAYSLPLLNRIITDTDTNKIDRSTGTLMIVLAPTRELTEQCASVISKLLFRAAFIITGAIHGGDDRHHEKNRLRKGIHVLVCTPGRLLDHLNQTNSFVRDKLQYVVLDEADRLLDMGFERSLREIMTLLPQPRKRVLVSATVTSAVERLSHFVLQEPIATVGATEDVFEIPDKLTQRFVNVPAKHRLVSLATLLWSRLLAPPPAQPNQQQPQSVHAFIPHHRMVNANQKIVVFVSTSDAVEFLFLLFSRLASPFSPSGANHNNSGGGGGGGFAGAGSAAAGFARAAAAAASSISVKKLTAEANKHLSSSAGSSGGIVEFGSDEDEDDARVAFATQMHQQQEAEKSSGHPQLSDEAAFLRSANIFKLHGNMGQVDRQAVYENFKKSSCAVLFCTDVAARGLDIPNIDLIVHYDPPQDERCYVHRVGRTARIGSSGESVLFVMPHEVEYVAFLSSATKRKDNDGGDDADDDGGNAGAAAGGAIKNTTMFEMSLDVLLFQLSKMDRKSGPGRHWQHAAAFLHKAMCDLVRNDQHIRQVSLFAYQSYVRAYAGVPRTVKRFFNQSQLHLGHIAASFANDGTPAQLQREMRGSDHARRERDSARDAYKVKKHGVQIDNTDENYHSTLLRKAMYETKNRLETGTAGLKQGATAIKGLTEFEA